MKRCLPVMIAIMLTTEAPAQPTAREAAYRNFPALVDNCRISAGWNAVGTLTYAPGGSPPMTTDPLSGAPPAARAAASKSVASERLFKREIWLSGEIEVPEVPAPGGRRFALLKEHDLWLRDGATLRPLTTGGTFDHSWDIEASQPTPFSPDGGQLFALRYDRSRVFRQPQVDYLPRYEKLTLVHMQKAGLPLDRPEAFIVPTDGGKPIAIDLGDTTDHYVRLLGWTPDGREVMMARYTRLFDRVDVLAADAATGAVRLVLTETAKTPVRLQHEVLWPNRNGFTMLSDGGFLWESQRSGWNQLYRYDRSGRPVATLTTGNAPFSGIVRVDEAGGKVYFYATREARVYDRNLYRVGLRGGRVERLTQGDGWHDVQYSPDGRTFIDSFSTVSTPPTHLLRRSDGSLVKLLATADISRLRALGWTAPEELRLKAADGVTDLRGVLYRPADFDPAKRYPLVEYVYGGPQSVYAPQKFCFDADFAKVRAAALAQRGYLVLILDGRGTAGRSRAFLDVAVGDWANHVVADHAGALRTLIATRPYIDPARVGVYGRSWGGYYAFRFLADAPDIYRAAVSIVPGLDPHGGMLYEPFLGMPDRNPRAYEDASPFRLAPKVQGRLMLVGTGLDSSTLVDVMKMSDAMVKADKRFDLLILPAQEHAILGSDADYMQDRIGEFFDTNLGTGK